MGIISPVGNRLDEAWKNVCEGNSGIQLVNDFDTSSFSTRIGGMVKDFDAAAYMSPKDIRKSDPFIHYGIAAGCSGASSPVLRNESISISGAIWMSFKTEVMLFSYFCIHQ